MTDKELNSHDLAREIEISKLQEENDILKGTIQTYNTLLKATIKENEELKSQLRGTTHCFDEEEHKKLKEEITNLSKDVDMWNSKYNDMFDENKILKEALETKSYCKYANKCDELDDCSREEYEDMANANVRLNVENYDLKEEIRQLKKQLENCYCNRTDCSGRIKDSKVYDSLVQKVETQQKEFIKYLQEELNVQIQEESIGCEITNKRYILEEILQEYKNIIGDDK